MRIVNIAEAKTRVGEQLSAVHGTIKSVFKRRTGEGQYGPYSFQDVIIKDDTGEMPCTFASYDEMTSKKGSKVTISAKHGEKGLSGLMVKDESYTDKKTDEKKEVIKLYVTGSAFVDFGTEPITDAPDRTSSPQVDDEEAQALKLLEEAKKKKAARLEFEAKAKAAQASQPAGKSLTKRDIQIVNLFRRALKGAVWACDKEGVPFWTESVATIFIAMRDDGLTDSMPVEFETSRGEVVEVNKEEYEKTPEPEVDQEPKTWQEVRYNGVELGSMPAGEIEMLFNTFKPKINPKTGNYDMSDLYLVNSLKAWKKEQV